jgi:hypothetical protein
VEGVTPFSLSMCRHKRVQFVPEDLLRFQREDCARTITGLKDAPLNPGLWSIVHNTTNGAPLPPIEAIAMDQVIQCVQFSDLLERDAVAHQVILLASDFAARNRPNSVADGLFKQSLQLAAKASIKFRRDRNSTQLP